MNQDEMTRGEYLAHYGVKGMRWGVRRNASELGKGGSAPKERGKIRRGATKANVALSAGAKVIDDGEKKLIFLPQKNRNAAASATQTRVLGEAADINRSPQFRGKDIKRDPALKAAYFSKVEKRAKDIYMQELNIARTEAWSDFLGVSSSTKSANSMQMRIMADKDRIRHADESDREVLLELDMTLNALGQISEVTVPEKYLKHSDDSGLGELGRTLAEKALQSAGDLTIGDLPTHDDV